MRHDTIILQDRELGLAELTGIRTLLATQPEWNRYRLSQALYKRWNWRPSTGHIKGMAARTRPDRFSRIEVPRKAVRVRALVANFQQELRA